MKHRSNDFGILAEYNCSRRKPRHGRAGHGSENAFTLVEIIGVVAVIAILASVLTPRVMEVIARSRVTGTAQSLSSLKGVITEYIVISNSLPQRFGYAITNSATAGGRFDADLLRAGLIDRLFASSIGSQLAQSTSGGGCTPSTPKTTTALLERPHIRSAPGGAASLVPVAVTISDVNFDLDGDGNGDFPNTTTVAYAYIPEVRVIDAIGLNKILDGDTLVAGQVDTNGRCTSSGLGTNNTVTVYVYLGQH